MSCWERAMTSEREFEVLLDARLREARASVRRRARRQEVKWWSAMVGVWAGAVALALWVVML